MLSWQGKTPALSTGCILTACELQAMSPSLPQTAKPFRARPGFWFLYGSTAGSLPTQKLLALHTAPTDGDPWSQGQAPGRCTVALHSSTRHEEGSSSIGRVPRDGGSILHKLGQSSCSCVSRDKTRLSVPKASPKHLGSPGCHCGRQARAAATRLSQQQAGHRDFVEFTPPRSALTPNTVLPHDPKLRLPVHRPQHLQHHCSHTPVPALPAARCWLECTHPSHSTLSCW